jgi:hypothetical protein
MPIDFFSFYPGLDIHVLRGQPSDPLSKSLFVSGPTKSGTYFEYRHTYGQTDVEVEFRPVFDSKAGVNAKGEAEFVAYGIHVTKAEGAVTVELNPPPPTPPAKMPGNFIVEAVVTKNTGGQDPAKFDTEIIRIHVHQHVDQIWLTPSKLSVRRPAAGKPTKTTYAFSVRAQFDDGTVGDIGNSGQFTLTPAANFASPDNMIIIPSGTPDGTVIPVSAKTSAAWNSCQSPDAQIVVLPAWEKETNLPQIQLVDAPPKYWTGVIRPEDVPNILFVPCGFTKAELGEFEKLMRATIAMYRLDSFSPFNHLMASLNCWWLPLESSTSGVSVRCEVQVFQQDGSSFAAPLPQPTAPPAPGNDWNVSHLLYAVGLPLPTDGPGQVTADDLKARWLDLLPIGRIPNASDDVIAEWQSFATRTLVDDNDNFPAIQIGSLPAASSGGFPSIEEHDLRGGSDERLAFFRLLSAAPRDGITTLLNDATGPSNLGNLWSDDNPARRFDNRGFVVLISNINTGRGNHGLYGGFVHLTQEWIDSTGNPTGAEPPGIPVTAVAGGNAVTLALQPASNTHFIGDMMRVIIHELSHGFGLGDEYVELAKTVEATSTYGLDYGNLDNITKIANADGSIRIDDIKWNWHRVRVASVLTKPVASKGGNSYHAYVAQARGLQFTKGDIIRLRKREKRKILDRAPLTSTVEFTLQDMAPNNLDDPNDTVNMTLVLEAAGAVDVSPFVEGCVIYSPYPAPITIRTPTHPYLTLVSPAAERIMKAIGGTMTGVACDAAAQAALHASTQIPAGKDPDGKVADTDLPDVVGVFFGGGLYGCGLVHPTGRCMMRDQDEGLGTVHFCPVCRYILVEEIDPQQHWFIDREYDKKYSY